QLEAQPTTEYIPPIRVQFERFKVQWQEREPIELFLKLLGEESILAIVTATNTYAESQMGPVRQYARTWHPLSSGELLCWLALLFYMAICTEKRRKDYWPSLS